MANSKYSQVIDLLAAGRLNWANNNIQAGLLRGATFDGSQKKLSQVGQPVAREQIQGRSVAAGAFLGYAVAFPRVAAGEYQVVVMQDNGSDPDLLAWYDTDETDGPLTIENEGTLVIRPVVVPDDLPPDSTSTIRVWMTVP